MYPKKVTDTSEDFWRMDMMKPEKEYLKSLIEITRRLFDEFEYPALDLSTAEISYIPTKKRTDMGLKMGLDGLAEMKKYRVKESSKIRSNCKFYQKFYKINGKIAEIESFIGGHDRMAGSYIAYYEENYRYLFPFYYDAQKAVGRYIYVTYFEDNRVMEEYMVGQNQIVYDRYQYSDGGKVGYYCINYVPSGKYPVLGESRGYYLSDSLEYVQEECYAWYQDMQ
ncbi:MAG: hypothetical protein K2K70_12600 [Lachnospiraceae bacterium]|nr:hypothetical protein [Lachnospiraceae bacterium]